MVSGFELIYKRTYDNGFKYRPGCVFLESAAVTPYEGQMNVKPLHHSSVYVCTKPNLCGDFYAMDMCVVDEGKRGCYPAPKGECPSATQVGFTFFSRFVEVTPARCDETVYNYALVTDSGSLTEDTTTEDVVKSCPDHSFVKVFRYFSQLYISTQRTFELESETDGLQNRQNWTFQKVITGT